MHVRGHALCYGRSMSDRRSNRDKPLRELNCQVFDVIALGIAQACI